jgi:hypothetical protein
MKFAGGSGRGEVLWLLSYGEDTEGRTSSLLGRNVVLCVWKIEYELTRFRVLVILFPYLSTACEQIRELQTSVVTEQTVLENDCLIILKLFKNPLRVTFENFLRLNSRD